jgi:hypothetical protein
MKAIQEPMLVKDLLKMRGMNMLSINPEYQRGAVWDQPKQKRLIDSVLRGYPIPLFYLHHIKTEVGPYHNDSFQVIDGQQRLNALDKFQKGEFKLFDPDADAAIARFPDFVRRTPCKWGRCTFDSLTPELQRTFLDTPLTVVKIETENANEARDLFVRLQAGMPLTSQEKRDAWPGQFTEFILKLAGKPGLSQYPGHDFFNEVMKSKATDRGKLRQLAAQIAMLYFTRRESNGEKFCDLKAAHIDDFYYQHLGFDTSSVDARRFVDILNKITELLRDQKRKKVVGHEAMHLVLLVDSLWDDYTRSWETNFASAFDRFRAQLATATKSRHGGSPLPHWLRYGIHARSNSDTAESIRLRHSYFTSEMLAKLNPTMKDTQRTFGPLEREILYYANEKKCAVCCAEVKWSESEVHHVEGHALGGRTIMQNGALVHKKCHPKGSAAVAFASRWTAQKDPPCA